MKRRLLLFGLALAGVAAVCAQPVSAQTNSYDLVATPGVPGTSGNWDVTIQKWDGTTDGPGTQFRIAFAHGEPFPDFPNDQATKVTLTFYSYLGAPGGVGTIPLQSITGDSGLSTITTSHPANPQSHDWVQTNVVYNGTTILENKADFNSPSPATVFLKKGGTNSFLESAAGRVNLKYKAYSVKVTLENSAGTRIWSATTDLSTVNAPEGSSLAMLATGLLPLGMLVRRRSRSRKTA
jgi:hypothetical protein